MLDPLMRVAILCHEMRWSHDDYMRAPRWLRELLWAKLSADNDHQKENMPASKPSSMKRPARARRR